MKSILYTVYQNGSAGLSNLVMSLELGVVLSALTDRLLILKGNKTPQANVVQYDGIITNAYPSRVTDLIDLGVPWLDLESMNPHAFVPQEICENPAFESVFYFPDNLSLQSDDFRSFASQRSSFITVGDDLQHVPVLSFSGGGSDMLCYYSSFFYLDASAQMQAHDALRRMRPKPEYAAFAARIVESLGSFNAVHMRRGDFKQTFGVTTLERMPAEAIEALDHHFARNECLVILTDEAADPFFDEIRRAYPHHVFLDHYILENFGAAFADLPAHDSIALAYISQLVASRSQDFIGTMTSTFTALIQRMRGNLGKDEPFKFLWNEVPSPDDIIERGRHTIGNEIPLEKGIMVEQRAGPYTWNRFNERLNSAWMREWPESFLDEKAMVARARGREKIVSRPHDSAAASDAPKKTDGGCYTIAFLEDTVVSSSDSAAITRSVSKLFSLMGLPSGSPPAGPPAGEVRIEEFGAQPILLVDGKKIAQSATGAGLLRRSYREVVRLFIHRHPELIWLHAGCVSSPDGAIVFPGSWGRGKSTLVLELCQQGCAFLSDDIVPLDPLAGTAIPFPGTPQVRPGSHKVLSRDQLSSLAKQAVPLDPANVAVAPQSVSRIVLPHFQAGATASLAPLSPAQALGELLENCLSFVNNDDASIQALCKMVENLPVHRLTFGDASDVAKLLIGTHVGTRSATRQDHLSEAVK